MIIILLVLLECLLVWNGKKLLKQHWKFIPPTVGGVVDERMMKFVNRSLGKALFNCEELSTILCGCATTSSSRPRTCVSDNNVDLKPITPSRFLHEIKEAGVPDISAVNINNIRVMWRIDRNGNCFEQLKLFREEQSKFNLKVSDMATELCYGRYYRKRWFVK